MRLKIIMGPKVPNELKESAFLHFSLQYYWRACDDFFWVGGDKTQAKPESPPTQKKAELRIVRVRVPPSDGTEARGGSLGRARMCVCVVL